MRRKLDTDPCPAGHVGRFKRNGIRRLCLPCNVQFHRNWMAKNPVGKKERAFAQNIRKYGITPAQYNEILERQMDCCAICFRSLDGLGKAVHIDHDHASGETRGILCGKCNVLLGMACDDTDILESAIQYLSVDRSGYIEEPPS